MTVRRKTSTSVRASLTASSLLRLNDGDDQFHGRRNRGREPRGSEAKCRKEAGSSTKCPPKHEMVYSKANYPSPQSLLKPPAATVKGSQDAPAWAD